MTIHSHMLMQYFEKRACVKYPKEVIWLSCLSACALTFIQAFSALHAPAGVPRGLWLAPGMQFKLL